MSLSSQTDIKASVVVATYERPDYLKSALEGVKKQTRPAFEVIVVDDCSNADYSDVIENCGLANIQFIRLAQNSGANVVRNTGIKLASGDVIALLDDDDVWTPDFLAEHVIAYQNGADAVICGFRLMHNQQKLHIHPDSRVTAKALRTGNGFAGMSGFSARRQLLQTLLLDPLLPNGQDWDLYVRIVQTGATFVNLQKALFHYRRNNPNGISEKAKRMAIEDVDRRLLSASKHKHWLGDGHFRKRVAEQILSHLPAKKSKLSWLKKSVKEAGIWHTCYALCSLIMRKASKA